MVVGDDVAGRVPDDARALVAALALCTAMATTDGEAATATFDQSTSETTPAAPESPAAGPERLEEGAGVRFDAPASVAFVTARVAPLPTSAAMAAVATISLQRRRRGGGAVAVEVGALGPVSGDGVVGSSVVSCVGPVGREAGDWLFMGVGLLGRGRTRMRVPHHHASVVWTFAVRIQPGMAVWL